MGGLIAGTWSDWWDWLWAWAEGNQALLWWLFAISLGSLVLAILLLPVVVVRLDADYFVASRKELRAHRTFGRWLFFALRNLAGLLFVVVGLALLLLPGQGLVMMLIGLLMLDVPGKRALELRIVRRPAILRLLNGLREKRGRPPFVIETGRPAAR